MNCHVLILLQPFSLLASLSLIKKGPSVKSTAISGSDPKDIVASTP